jgi:EAL domain-containing protein (putative c-di-GMP-specific phosphodiesterase class I)
VLHDALLSAETANLPITDNLSIRSYLGVPIMRRSGDVFGTFCCFSSTPDPTLNDRDVQLMQLFATFVAGLLEDELTQEEQNQRRLRRINQALTGDVLQTVYQPILNLAENRVVGYEALSRFQIEPAQPPDEWFREAGAVRMQEKLEIHAIRKALVGMPRIPNHAYLAFNVSPSTVLSGELDALLSSAPAHRLTLEITEHAHVDDYAALERALQALRSRGVRVAVDDAGAGFASFRHIVKLRPDIIKIDRSLIALIDKDVSARAMAAALIRFAAETCASVVAEGVETEAELAVLRALAAEKAQGYLLGRPGPLPTY